MVTKPQSEFHLAPHSHPSHRTHLSPHCTLTAKPAERHLPEGLSLPIVHAGGGQPTGFKTQQAPSPPSSPLPQSSTLQVAPSQVLFVLECSLWAHRTRRGTGSELRRLFLATSPHLLLRELCHFSHHSSNFPPAVRVQ